MNTIIEEAEALSKELIEADKEGNPEEAWAVFEELYDKLTELDKIYGEGFLLSAIIAARLEDEERGGKSV